MSGMSHGATDGRGPEATLCPRSLNPKLLYSPQVGEDQKRRVSGAWFPHSTLESLEAALLDADAAQDSPHLRGLGSRLEAALRRHREAAVRQSNALEQAVKLGY